MAETAAARAVAARLHVEHRKRVPYSPVADMLPAGDLATAYEAQAALHTLMAADGAGAIAGHKIALTSRAMQELCGVDHPLAGAVFDSMVHRSPARLKAGAFVHLGIECEVAVRLRDDLGPEDAPFDRERVAAAVDACMPAFELIEDRGADYATIDAVSLVADNCWNGGVVLGEPMVPSVRGWLDPAFSAARTALKIDGAEVGAGKVGDAMGHPLEAVAWIAGLLAARGERLRAGQFVMTGSTITTRFPRAGDTLRFTIRGFGEATLTVVP